MKLIYTKTFKFITVLIVMVIYTALYNLVGKRLIFGKWIQFPVNESINYNMEENDPILIIFTTFKVDSPHHLLAHRLAISNWASFGGLVKPVLFAGLSNDVHKSDTDILNEAALEKGWDVLPIPSVNKFGTPHLRPMYNEIFKNYNASFYGYANGDLLFTDGMIESLRFVDSILRSKLSNNVLMVGRRTDIQLYSNSCLTPENVNGNKTISTKMEDEQLIKCESYFDKSNLDNLATKGTLRHSNAIDYFFFTRNNSTFNWSAIADVVIGRRAYDQYLVAKAIEYGMNTIDLTLTALVTHLAKPHVPNTGFLNKDSEHNVQIIGKNFKFEKGLTTTTLLYLKYNNTNHDICLVKRK